MTELESYFINFELTEDERGENEPAEDETTEDGRPLWKRKRAEDDPTEDQIPAKKGILFHSITK